MSLTKRVLIGGAIAGVLLGIWSVLTPITRSRVEPVDTGEIMLAGVPRIGGELPHRTRQARLSNVHPQQETAPLDQANANGSL